MTASARVRLSIAIEHYDRFVPLLDRSATPSTFDLDVLQVGQSSDGRDGGERHERMLQNGEFDIAELSLSSYLMARARNLPFTAIPYFPRRLFSQSQLWINGTGPIHEPRDLIGQSVGLNTFQTTLSVLAKGDLQAEYGVPWRDIAWVVARDETIPFAAAEGVTIRKAPDGVDISDLLVSGDIAAIFSPVPPRAVFEPGTTIRRLFSDPKAEETRYYRKNGFYPIMHVMGVRNDVAERHPDLLRDLYDMLLRVDAVTERFYDDPNWSRLAWGRLDLEDERERLGPDLWTAGFARNRANLERFIGYSHDQGLIPDRLAPESLFATDFLAT